MRVVALIPAFNEEKRIASTLKAVSLVKFVDQIIVIDDGSTDSTFAIATNFSSNEKIKVFRFKANQGKGAALNYGREKVVAEIYLLLDADLGSTAVLAEELLKPILDNEVDMTIANLGSIQTQSDLKMGFGLVRHVASLGVKLFTGKKIISPLSGQRGVKAEVLQAVGAFNSGFGVEVGLTIGALHHGFKILEIPLEMKHRAYGRGLKGLWHRGRQLLHVLGALWQCWKRGWLK